MLFKIPLYLYGTGEDRSQGKIRKTLKFVKIDQKIFNIVKLRFSQRFGLIIIGFFLCNGFKIRGGNFPLNSVEKSFFTFKLKI